MEGICAGKGIVIRINLTFGLFRFKTRNSCVYNALPVNWWDNDLLEVLVAL